MPLLRCLRLVAPLAACVAIGCDTVIPEDTIALGRRLLVNERSACALDRTGAVFCWGMNSELQEFGVEPLVIGSRPMPVPVPVPRLVSLASGVGNHSCGVDAEARLVCWGRGDFGQLGRGELLDEGGGAAPLESDVEWQDVTVGRLTTCARSRDDVAWCWGSNQRGEIGLDTVPIGARATTPRRVVNGDVRFTRVATGWRHACGIARDGQAFCWGHNSVGELGNGVADSLARRIPTLVAGGHTFTDIAASARHTCAIDDAGAAWCWGNNQFGQLGDGTTTDRESPTRVTGDHLFTRVVTASGFASFGNAAVPNPRAQGGIAHTCALTAAGAAFCWGWNGNGQLGDGTTVTRLEPVAVSGGLLFDEIGAGGTYTCGMRASAAWCWGGNFVGQLGSGTTLPRTMPTPVMAPFDRP